MSVWNGISVLVAIFPGFFIGGLVASILGFGAQAGTRCRHPVHESRVAPVVAVAEILEPPVVAMSHVTNHYAPVIHNYGSGWAGGSLPQGFGDAPRAVPNWAPAPQPLVIEASPVEPR